MIEINLAQSRIVSNSGSRYEGFRKLGRFLISAMSLMGGIAVAVLLQALISSLWDGFYR